MGLVREPLDVDFFVDPRPLTEKGKEMISDFIKTDKDKRKRKKTSKKAQLPNKQGSERSA